MMWMLDGLPMRPDYNHAISIFLPKGSLAADLVSVSRAPGSTRPLSLRNTGAKAISSALNHPLKRAVQEAVAPARLHL